MKVGFSSNRLKRQLSDAAEIKRSFGVNAKRVAQRMAELNAAPNLKVLQQIPAANCHPLTGDRSGEWALDISARHRMIFVIDHDPVPVDEDGVVDCKCVTAIRIEEITNYH